MVTGYEAGFYRDMTQLKQDLDSHLAGIQGQLEMHSEMLQSIERTMLIASVMTTILPHDIKPLVKLQIAANVVDEFLKTD